MTSRVNRWQGVAAAPGMSTHIGGADLQVEEKGNGRQQGLEDLTIDRLTSPCLSVNCKNVYS